MSDKLPFKLRESYYEIAASNPGAFWDRVQKNKEITDLLYRPNILQGGQAGSKSYRIKDKKFSNVSFAHTEISKLDFFRCQFENCIFIRTTFDRLEFHACSFKNCNFGKCRIRDTYIDPFSFSDCLDIKKDANIGIHLYQQLMRNFKDLDQPDFHRDAEFMFRRFRRSETWYKLQKNKISCWEGYPMVFGNFLAQFFLGYGVKIWHFICTTIGLFLFFWMLNSWYWMDFGLTALCDTCTFGSWDVSLYYTAISLSNLGYGDIVPSSTFGRVWASIQAVVGAVWFAMMASMIFRKISSR